MARNENMNGDGGRRRFRLANEFATVDIELCPVPHGAVLQVTDARTGISVRLDALEVQALTGLDRRDLDELVNWSAGGLRRIGATGDLDGNWFDEGGWRGTGA